MSNIKPLDLSKKISSAQDLFDDTMYCNSGDTWVAKAGEPQAFPSRMSMEIDGLPVDLDESSQIVRAKANLADARSVYLFSPLSRFHDEKIARELLEEYCYYLEDDRHSFSPWTWAACVSSLTTGFIPDYPKNDVFGNMLFEKLSAECQFERYGFNAAAVFKAYDLLQFPKDSMEWFDGMQICHKLSYASFRGVMPKGYSEAEWNALPSTERERLIAERVRKSHEERKSSYEYLEFVDFNTFPDLREAFGSIVEIKSPADISDEMASRVCGLLSGYKVVICDACETWWKSLDAPSLAYAAEKLGYLEPGGPATSAERKRLERQQAKNDAKQQRLQVKADGKSKVVAALLAIFLGSLGVHKFYLGKTKAGVITLLVTILGAPFFFIGPTVMQVIGVIEGVIYLTKSPEEFRSIYVLGDKEWF